MDPAPVWTYALKGRRHVSARRPLVHRGAVYAVFTYGTVESVVVCCDARSGSVRWDYVIPHVATEAVPGRQGGVFVSSFGGQVYALAADGSLAWCAAGPGRNLWVPCPVGDEHLVVAEVGAGARHTWCLDQAGGNVRWRFDNGGHSSSVASAAGRVVHSTCVGAGGEHRLYCLSAGDGRLLWTAASERWLFHPRIADGVVYVGARGGLDAYDLGSGRPVARLELGTDGDVHSDVVCTGGRLYFGDSEGLFHAASASVSPAGAGLTLQRSWKRVAGRNEWRAAPKAAMVGNVIACLSAAGAVRGMNTASGKDTFRTELSAGDDPGGGLAAHGTSLYAAHGRHLALFSPRVPSPPPRPLLASISP